MMRRWALGTKQGMAVGIAALLLCVGLASPREAAAKHTCKVSQTLVRVDTKTCKPNRFRPTYTLSRACCQKANGHVTCHKYHKCPKHSPSALS
ncbi:MAG: hypothetical protein E6J71_29730 [Deltaproteobacteria bacterium]|nr:MAG: hypothetical protein E6J71_29730 [Deltaproteobacteria bacterium]